MPNILLPIALSFITFQQIAFLSDCYKQSKEHSSLGNHSNDLVDFRSSQTTSLVSLPKSTKNIESTTANIRMLGDSSGMESLDSKVDSTSLESIDSNIESNLDSALDSKDFIKEDSQSLDSNADSTSLDSKHSTKENSNHLDSSLSSTQTLESNKNIESSTLSSSKGEKGVLLKDASVAPSPPFTTPSSPLHAFKGASHNSIENSTNNLDSASLEDSNYSVCGTHPLKASSGERESVREGEGSDFAIQAPSPSLESGRLESDSLVGDSKELKVSNLDSALDSRDSKPFKDSKVDFILDSRLDSKDSTDSTQTLESNKITLNFLDYALFITFFPQLIAGPIVHHKEMMPQFSILNKFKGLPWESIAKGLFIFCIGLFKKVCLADSFAKIADAGFNAASKAQSLNLLESWATSLSYTFQLYFDFSGYCDMAIGLALFFGIMLPINFNSPYKSLNIAEFWQRWHITLGRFLKEYLYIPLGGNKNECYKNAKAYILINKILTLRNLFLVAFISGIWHGAGFGFIIWGILHGSAMVAHRIYTYFYKALDSTNRYRIFMQSKIYKILCWIITFNFINIAWVFFRASDIKSAISIIHSMFFGTLVLPKSLESKLSPFINAEFGNIFLTLKISTNTTLRFLILGFLISICFKNSMQYIINAKNMFIAGIFFVLSVWGIGVLDYSPIFIYFNF